MKKLIPIFCFLVIFFLAVSPVFARTVRVSYYEYPGCHLQSSDGTKSGYGYDFMELLAKEAGWEVEYVGYERPWGEMLDMLEQGELDVVDFVGWDSERSERMLFSERPMAYSGCSIRTTPENVSRLRVDQFGNWGHVRVGTLEGDQNEVEFCNFAEDHSIDYEIRRFATEEEGTAALKRGELDMVAFDGFAVTEGLQNIETYNPCRNHLVTRKDDVELMNEINSAMASLDRKHPGWMASFRAKYYPVPTVVAYIPGEESIGSAQYQYLQALLLRLNEILDAKIELKECKRDFYDADFTVPSFACGVYFSPENIRRFSMPNHSAGLISVELLAPKDSRIFQESLGNREKPLKIGYIRGEGEDFNDVLEEYAMENAMGYELVCARDESELHRWLAEGRLDLVMRPNGMCKDLEVVVCCGHIDFFLAPPKDQKALAHSISEALRYLRMDEPEYIYNLERQFFNSSPDKTRFVRLGAYLERGISVRREDGDFVGFAYELSCIVAKRKGWELRPVALTFAEALRALNAGTIDMIGAVVWTPERAEKFDYSKTDLGPLYYSLLKRQNGRMKENRPETWNHAKVGYLRGSLAIRDLEKYFAERNVQCQLIPFNNVNEAEHLVRSGRLDAVYTLPTKESGDLVPLVMLPTNLSYFCFNKAKPWLKAEFDATLEELLRENHRCILDLYEKYLFTPRSVLSLDVEEIAYVSSRKDIKTIVSFNAELPPFVSVDKRTGQIDGFFPRVFNRIAERTGLTFEYRLHDPDADVVVSPNGDEPDDGHDYVKMDWVASPLCWVKRKHPLPETKGVVALPMDRKEEIDYVTKCGYKALRLDTFGECYRAVDEGRAEMTIDRLAVARFLIDEIYRFPSMQCQQIDKESFSRPISIFFPTSTNPRMWTILSKASEALTTDELDTMLFETVYGKRPASVDMKTLFIVVAAIVLIAGVMLLLSVNRTNLARAENRAKTAFLFNMSHDIRTPMNAIMGYTDIALRHANEPDKVTDSLAKIRVSGSHLLNLINDILEMSRIEAGKMVLSEQPLDIREAIECVRHMSAALALPKSIDFQVHCDTIRNPYIFADELHINEVLINVISNAVKYTDIGGKVRYKIEQIGAVVNGKVLFRFEISDSGIGMSEEFQQHLFEVFSRERNSTVSSQEGTGIGLAIVKRITDLFGGTIQVRSKTGKGTSFTIEIPFRALEEKEIAEFLATKNKKNEAVEKSSQTGKRILVVEDNEMNREIASEMLTEAGMVVETAEDGEIAVKMISSKPADYYDCVLMDIQMPVMNGYEATTAIRALPGFDKLPIIALSANAFEEDRQKSLSVGMNAHEPKPIQINSLLDTMRKLIG